MKPPTRSVLGLRAYGTMLGDDSSQPLPMLQAIFGTCHDIGVATSRVTALKLGRVFALRCSHG